VVYPNILSAKRSLPHGEGLPVPEPPKQYHTDSDVNQERRCDGRESLDPTTSKDPEFVVNMASNEPHRITQNEVRDLVRVFRYFQK
jgi:hypothetical protein